VIARSGPPVRIETTPGERAGFTDGVPVFSPSGWQGVINRRPRADGLTIVVSRSAGLAFCARLPDRCAIVSPDTAPKDGAAGSPGPGVRSVTRFIRAV
jgi:hypothetical protein